MQRSLRDERGVSLILVAIGLFGFVAATALAVDVGMFMTARAQAQNSADAGALAGATALAFDDFDDRTASGPAVQNAMAAALANKVMSAGVSVKPEDVTFPLDANGRANMVQVRVYRSDASGRDNPLSTLFGLFIGLGTANVDAVATAQVAPANALSCVKPFMIPDKWREVQTPAWDPGDDYNIVDNQNNPLPNPDVYVPWGDGEVAQAGFTGYTEANDTGTPLVLRAGTGDQPNPSFYYSWKMPGDTGGDFYRDNIASCNQSVITRNTTIIQEPGNMSGPTIQGIDILIAKDPNAYFEPAPGCNCVKNSAFGGQSPRVFPIPLYDPYIYANGKANGRPADFKIANFIGFFADHTSGNEIYGRITTVVGMVDPDAGPAPAGAFVKAIRLVSSK